MLLLAARGCLSDFNPRHGWMAPPVSAMNTCDELLDAAMEGSPDNPALSADSKGTRLGRRRLLQNDAEEEHGECMHSGAVSGDVSGSSMCNGVDFMGIHNVATGACMAEAVGTEVSSSMIRCEDGIGYVFEWEQADCSGDAQITAASVLNVTVECDAFEADCDSLTIRHGEMMEDGECSFENFYDVAISMADCYDVGGLGVAYISMHCDDEQLTVSEYLEDGCTGSPDNVTRPALAVESRARSGRRRLLRNATTGGRCMEILVDEYWMSGSSQMAAISAWIVSAVLMMMG